MFKVKSSNSFFSKYGDDGFNIRHNGFLLSGLTDVLMMIPEAIMIAFFFSVNPMVGLYAALMIGIITAVFSGRFGAVEETRRALVIVAIALVSVKGIELLFITMIMMVIFQYLTVAINLTKHVRLGSRRFFLRFANAVSIAVFGMEFIKFEFLKNNFFTWITVNNGLLIYIMMGLIIFMIAVFYFIPRVVVEIPYNFISRIPKTVAVKVLGVSTIVLVWLSTYYISMAEVSIANMVTVLPYAGVLAALGFIESLMPGRI